jgi:hypothetical protein
MAGLVGQALAKAVHPVVRAADPSGAGMLLADIEAAATAAGIEIGGRSPRQVLGTEINNAQDLYKWVSENRWRWIEPVVPPGPGLSGIALAEEAYIVAMRHDPEGKGIRYNRLMDLLVADGVIIRGANPGRTMYSALLQASDWFEWVSSATFRWK